MWAPTLLSIRMKIVCSATKIQCFQFHTGKMHLKTIPGNLKGKSSSSQNWLTRQMNDPYVKKARELDYRARSAFKLLEMDAKLKILKPGLTVIECGAAPGAWSQVVVERINSDSSDPDKKVGKLIGVDLLPIAPLAGAHFLPFCDFTNPETQLQVQEVLFGSGNANSSEEDKRVVDLILSDMAPNATGVRDMDSTRICNLVRSVLEFACQFGKPGSHFLAKVWAGSEMKSLENDILQCYRSLQSVKPKSSREDSSELFIFAKSMRKFDSG